MFIRKNSKDNRGASLSYLGETVSESPEAWVKICRAILDGTKYEVVKKETVRRPSLIARVEALEVEQLKGKEHGEKS